MNLDTLTRAVAAQEDEPIGIIKAALAEIRAAVTNGEAVHIDGFGKFRMKESDERVERRPQHGRTVVHPPHRLPIFKASAEWRKEVNAVGGGDQQEAA